MKKVKFDKDQRLYREDFFQLLRCPLSNTKKIEVFCGPWCAWFDIEEKAKVLPSPYLSDYTERRTATESLARYYCTEVCRVVTCKGTPIGELVEEEKENE